MTSDQGETVASAKVPDEFNEDPMEYLSTEDLEAARMSLERISQTRREAEVQSQNLRVG
jgi:hypothetical protein